MNDFNLSLTNINTVTASNVIAFNPLTESSKATAGHRLVKTTFKTDKENGIKRPSVASLVPMILAESVRNNIDTLMPAIIGYLESVQDDIVREAIEADKTAISYDNVSMEAIAAYVAENARGDRLSKALLESWFNEVLEEPLTMAVSAKLGISPMTPDNSEVFKILANTLAAYKKHIIKLSAPSISISDMIKDNLLKALSLVSNDSIGAKLISKLSLVSQAKEDLLAL